MSTGELEEDDRKQDQRVRLRTARLLLRPPERRDAPEVAKLCDNPKVVLQTARMPYPYGERDAEAWIARARSASTDQEVSLLVTRLETGEILGGAGFGALESGEPEIGYWIGEPYWGQGYATEAVQAVIDCAFARRGLPRLIGRCRVGNPASRRVLEKCGFQYQAAGMVHSRALKGPVPTEDFCLERYVWQSLKRWGRQPASV